MDTLQKIKDNKIIAIVRGVYGDDALRLSEALIKGGVNLIEVTFDQTGRLQDTAETIRSISEHFGGDFLPGAGTVMTTEQVLMAKEAGARYIISPNVKEAVIRETKKQGLISLPGAYTPSEAVDAVDFGADIVKIFPATVLGPAYFKAILAPLKHISMMAVGGIDENNAGDYIKAGAIGVGVGGTLANKKLIAEGRFDLITETAHKLHTNVFVNL
ncbi:MAG: bifunctional 4-hydroxy-2-oxoglutarate aldolase/2-dehydro-3-deoxy-phosphogluconate aldolase [Eubacteriales bacterium]|nr:bifunctional 4-hydroxy-2-oxoglutarate aldolase/2-dehydro-3-deoxy-phosphogluconate aldolase [Eubacteriales bacterium]